MTKPRSTCRSRAEDVIQITREGHGERGAGRRCSRAPALRPPAGSAPALTFVTRRSACDALRPTRCAPPHHPSPPSAPAPRLTRHHVQRAERGIARARFSRLGGAPVEPSAAWSHEDERGLRGPRVATNSCLVHALRSRLLRRTVRVRVGARKGRELVGNASRHDDSRSSCALDSCRAPHRPLSSPPLSALGVSTSDWPHRAGRPVHVRGNLTRRLGMDA